MPWLTILRRSVACHSAAAFVALAGLHLTLRPRPWIHEWYWTLDAYHFVTILLAPLVAGTAAWDGARWSGATDTVVAANGLARAFRSAWVPCEKLRRATSMPAATSRSSCSTLAEAGPMVHTIFVRRIRRLRTSLPGVMRPSAPA